MIVILSLTCPSVNFAIKSGVSLLSLLIARIIFRDLSAFSTEVF